MITLNKNAKIMMVAAHPDDEILGCGATIHKWVRSGAQAHALILAEGLTARAENRGCVPEEDRKALRKNAGASAEIIGYDTISFEDFPDNRMDGVDLFDVVRKISVCANKIRPDIVLTHHHGDLNIDHRVVFQAVITAFRPLADCGVHTILTFETPSATEWNFPYYKNTFSPNVFIDAGDGINAKISAMSCYESEARKAPHPRAAESLRAIAQRWGSVIGLPYAEAFELIRTKITG